MTMLNHAPSPLFEPVLSLADKCDSVKYCFIGVEVFEATNRRGAHCGLIRRAPGYGPMISLRPSTTWINSSGVALPIREPIRSTARVPIWLILTQDFL